MAEPVVMRDRPQGRTWIAIIREHLDAWRRENHWSRETLVQQIVEAHERLRFDRLTGLRFEPSTTDPYNRQKVNAERVYRWLDDLTKDKNLLGANLLPSILAGMPVERRLALADLTDGIAPGEPEAAQAKIGLAMKALRRARGFVDGLQRKLRRRA